MMQKQMPHDDSAEQSVLGAILLDPVVLGKLQGKITAADFYNQRHGELFEAFRICALKGNLDIVTAKAELEKRGTFEKCGGLKYLAELSSIVPTSAAVMEYAKIVRECSERRRLILVHNNAMEKYFDRAESVKKINDYVQAELVKDNASRGVTAFGDALFDYLNLLEERKKQGDKLPGLATGFDGFDVMTGGLESGKLYVIGARPAMGKTALALNITQNLSAEGKTVMFVSLEMQRNEIVKRIASSLTRIESYKLKCANVTDNDFVKIADISKKITAESLQISDESYETAAGILSKALNLNARLKPRGKRIDVVVIDYLQLIASSNPRIDRRLVIGEASRACKIMAKRLNCPVLLLSQLSRANEARVDKRPMLSDLRESGEIEQDADVVAFLHREEYYKPIDDNKGLAELIIAKNRDGECGKIKLGWNAGITSFEDYDSYTSGKDCKVTKTSDDKEDRRRGGRRG